MEVRNRQDAKLVCITRRHGIMSTGKVLEEELCLKAAALLFVVTGEVKNRRRGERSSRCGGVVKDRCGDRLLVREVGVALVFRFYSGRRDMCICCLCFARAFT